MRHPVRDRLVMLLFAIACFGAAALLVAVTFGFVMLATVDGWVSRILALSSAVKIACAVVCVLLGFALLGAMLPPKKKRSSSFAIQQNENGTVRISLKAIDALVNKCLGQHSEIKVVTSSLFSDEETVRVDVHIALLTDISMPLAISALQKQITKYVEACSGVNVKEVRVFVDATIPGGETAQASKYALPPSVLGEDEELTEEEVPVSEEIPAMDAQEPQTEEETPAAEEEIAEETPADEETEAAEEAPQAPSDEAAPAAEETPVIEEAPAEAEAPAVQEAPVEEEVPAAEEPAKKKGFLGLFAKK